MLPPPALLAAHFDRNNVPAISGKGLALVSYVAGHMHPTYEDDALACIAGQWGSFGRKGGLNRNALALGIFGSQKKVHSNVHFFLSRSLHT